MRKNDTIKLLVLLLFFVSALFAQKDFVEDNYEKSMHRIEMRDGKTLFTVVYSPQDKSETYPILLTRTPYSCKPYGENEYPESIVPNHNLEMEKYIFVIQDVRGMFMSEGKYENMRPVISDKDPAAVDELTDTYDTIDWLVKNVPNNSGKVGMWGISYPGFYAAMGAICGHPALKAVSPQAPIADWFLGDDVYHNGALHLSLTFNFISVFGIEKTELNTEWPSRPVYPNVDQYKFFLEMGSLKNVNEKYFKNKIDFWNKITKHSGYDDFWKARSSLPHFHNVKPATMVVGGWYDGEDLFGALKTYASIEEKNKDNNNILVMGPWPHGGWSREEIDHFGDMKYPFNTSQYYRDQIELQFFNYYLKEKGNINLSEATLYDTGLNKFASFKQWPPENTVPVTFNLKNEETEKDYEEYISDPAFPVPYTTDSIAVNSFYNKRYMNEDQRFIAFRPDILKFEKELDEEITIAGEIEVELFTEISGTDADFVVKLIDVFPDTAKGSTFKGAPLKNYQMLLRGDIFRGKYRKGFNNPQAFTPGKVEKVKFKLQDVFHTFKKGHKLMIQVQSSWFPLFDRNPQTFTDIFNAKEKDFIPSLHKIYTSEKYPSNIKFRKIKGKVRHIQIQ